MSEDLRELYYHQPYHEGRRHDAPTFPYSSADGHLQMLDPSSYLSFSDFLHGSTDHGSLSAAYGASKEEQKAVGGGETTPATPNSSISSSSTEAAAAEEDSNKSKKEKESATGDDENSKKEYVYIMFAIYIVEIKWNYFDDYTFGIYK